MNKYISNDVIYEFFADYIFRNIGIVYRDDERYKLDSRLKIMAEHYNVDSVEKLYEMYMLKVTPEMHSYLLDVATNNETFFMRDRKIFTAISKNILPELLAKHNNGALRIWSSGCSTGQEVYSILMMTKDSCSGEQFERIRLDASDISERCLNKAKSGTYIGLEVQRGLPAKQMIKYFDQNEDEGWTIHKEFISKINFFQHNLLLDSFPVEEYHIVFCRNVLIYQERDNKIKILRRVYDSLKAGGHLVVGGGENLVGLDIPFKPLLGDGALIYVKE